MNCSQETIFHVKGGLGKPRHTPGEVLLPLPPLARAACRSGPLRLDPFFFYRKHYFRAQNAFQTNRRRIFPAASILRGRPSPPGTPCYKKEEPWTAPGRPAAIASLLLDPAHRDVPVVLVAPEVAVRRDEPAEVVPPLPVDLLLLGIPVLSPDRFGEFLSERECLVLGPLERGRIPPYGDADPADRSRPEVGQGVVHVGDDIVLMASARSADGAAELAGEHLAVDGVRHAVEDRL